jgi:hypothetical protein
MKAKEFIFEGPWDAAKSVAAKAADTAQQMKAGYKSGYNKMDTLLSPSKWGAALSGQEKTDTEKNTGKLTLPAHVVRDVLSRAGAGSNLYRADIETLKKIYADVKSGNIKSNDPAGTADIIKKAYSGGSLSKDQGSVLTNLSKQF